MNNQTGDSQKTSYSKLYIAIFLALNITLSVSIIFVNKLLYVRILFPNMTLTCVHFVFTTIGMLICKKLQLFEFKVHGISHSSIRKILIIPIAESSFNENATNIDDILWICSPNKPFFANEYSRNISNYQNSHYPRNYITANFYIQKIFFHQD